ncbi:DUF1559 domain-containing protein [Haloferula rosea]|uniref:DUF1559 domain-containing protein n=1 Tax=Haloferula rosea TaxID=490093 RepID=A0A934RHY8_9BACT|nr:DUF1559 domain-containing protein [Haloferula rosea]MBK1828861.1 DUF1559 domain-containing protein [Haloferula rosea]
MKTHRPKFRASGFTLTELMIVIVIVAVLASLAFMVSSRVRERATSVTCTNNLRQIGLGLASFQADFKRYPGRNDGKAWDRAILPYLGYDGEDELRGNGAFSKSQWPQLENPAAYFACPSDRKERSADKYPRSYAIVPWTTNWSNGTAFRGWKDRPFNVGVPVSIVRKPAKAATVVEWHSGTERIENAVGSGGHAYHDRGGPDGPDDDVHRRNQIVLFADGHTEVLPFMSNSEFVEKYWPGSLGSAR